MSQIIHVGGTPATFDAFADFFDGHTARKHRVRLNIDNDLGTEMVLLITLPDDAVLRWPVNNIRLVRDQAAKDGIVLRLYDNALARLVIRDDTSTERGLLARCPNLHKRAKVKGRLRIATWAFGAVASVALIILVFIPIMANQLAELLPPEGERAFGESTFEQIRAGLDETGLEPLRICDGGAGLVALNRLRFRLEDQTELPYPLTVHVLDYDLINAFALPGGHIVFFRGLIDNAETPEEVASVFAHEIGHVVHRDPTRIALRSAGSIGVLGLLFGDFAGGTVVSFLTGQMVEATYTKEAESAADDFAHDILAKSGISPIGLATLFERLTEGKEEPTGLAKHFMTHPAAGDRIAKARKAAAKLTDATPAMTKPEWKAFKAVCN